MQIWNDLVERAEYFILAARKVMWTADECYYHGNQFWEGMHLFRGISEQRNRCCWVTNVLGN